MCNNEGILMVTAQYYSDGDSTMGNVTCMPATQGSQFSCAFKGLGLNFNTSNSAAINLTFSGSNITDVLPLEFSAINDSVINITVNGNAQYFTLNEKDNLDLNQSIRCISSLQTSIEGTFSIESLNISEFTQLL